MSNGPKTIVGKFDELNNVLIKEDYEINKSDLKKVLISRIDIATKEINTNINQSIEDIKLQFFPISISFKRSRPP